MHTLQGKRLVGHGEDTHLVPDGRTLDAGSAGSVLGVYQSLIVLHCDPGLETHHCNAPTPWQGNWCILSVLKGRMDNHFISCANTGLKFHVFTCV